MTTGGAGGQIDPTQIQVVDLAKTIQDPLAAKLRERLKSDFGVVKNSKGKLGVDCVFSTEALVYPQADGSVCAMKATAEGPKRMDCASGFWRGHYGDRHLWLCCRLTCAEEDDGESGAPELSVLCRIRRVRVAIRQPSNLSGSLKNRLVQSMQPLGTRGAELRA